MAVSNLHVLHGIYWSGGFLSQITNSRVSPAVETIVSVPAGHPYPMFSGKLSERHEITFDTEQVVTAIGAAGTVLTSLGQTDLFFKKAVQLAAREAAATEVHTRLRAAQCGLLIERLTAGHRQKASASARLIMPYDGVNAPLVPTGSVALSGTPAASQNFVVGQWALNGSAIPGVQNVSVDFGHQLIQVGGEGEVWDTFAATGEIRPTLTITCLSLPWATHYLGTALTSMSGYFRAASTTGRDADNSSSHIKFTATAGLITIDETSAGGNTEATTTIRVTLAAPDATTAPLIVATGQQIT